MMDLFSFFGLDRAQYLIHTYMNVLQDNTSKDEYFEKGIWEENPKCAYPYSHVCIYIYVLGCTHVIQQRKSTTVSVASASFIFVFSISFCYNPSSCSLHKLTHALHFELFTPSIPVYLFIRDSHTIHWSAVPQHHSPSSLTPHPHSVMIVAGALGGNICLIIILPASQPDSW